MFPKSLVSMRTNTGRYLTYDSEYKDLELLKEELGLRKDLTWHCPRIYGATREAQLGISRAIIKEARL